MKNNLSVFHGILVALFFFSAATRAYAQNPKSFHYENEFEISIPVKDEWSILLGVGNRGMVLERMEGEKLSGYQHQHIEFNQFTNYQTSKSIALSIGLRYRFEEVFDASETNEFRIIEQLEYKHSGSGIGLSHRFRTEQRFKENFINRIRYEIGVRRAVFTASSLTADTETLYAVSAHLKPEVEQRFSIGFENSSLEGIEIGLSLEYRMENYTRELAHEIFIISGVAVDF